jgi:N-methylhydantoinase A/oxoprolinase/acetone carboxylase beta subunit
MELEDRGAVSHVGFTPSDALQVVGIYTKGSVKSARTAAEILGKRLGLSAEQFAQSVIERFEARLTEEILKKHVSDEISSTDFAHNSLWEYIKARSHPRLQVEISLSTPIVGLGAPVDAYLPPVCSRLGCGYIRCPQAGAGSAYGAITGKVVARIDAIVRKQGSDKFLIFLPDERVVLEKCDEKRAMSYEYESAQALARTRVEELGSKDVRIEVRENTYRLGMGKVSVMAVGLPQHSKQTATIVQPLRD